MADQTIKCVGCQIEFVFTEGEQAFFAQNQFQTPKRCKPCRDERKAKKAQNEAPPGSQQYNDAPRDDDRRPPRGRKGGRRDNRDERH